MKKYFLSLAVIVIFAFYTVFNNQNSVTVAPPTATSTAEKNVPAPSSSSSGSTSSISSSGKNPPPATKSKGQYKDGTYTGAVADAFYGNVQIQATVAGGTLTNVQFLQYPNDRGTSREINGQAMPYLIQEALQAQSANVQIVSGATQTSGAFQQSLADALAQAKA